MVKPIKEAAKFLWNGTIYALSLPERYVRGLSALVGGIFKETTEILVPNFVKDTTSYNILVGNILRFTVENIKNNILLVAFAISSKIPPLTNVSKKAKTNTVNNAGIGIGSNIGFLPSFT